MNRRLIGQSCNRWIEFRVFRWIGYLDYRWIDNRVWKWIVGGCHR